MSSTEMDKEKMHSNSQKEVGSLEKSKIALSRLFHSMFMKSHIDMDEYLQANISASNTISLEAILMCTQVRNICTDSKLVIEVLTEVDHLVTFTLENGLLIRALMKIEQNTLILRDIPSSTPLEQVKSIFEDVENCPRPVSIRSDIGDTWFVTFANESDARSALLISRTCMFNEKPVRCRLKTESATKSFYRGPGATPLTPPLAPTSGVSTAALAIMDGSNHNNNNVPAKFQPPLPPLPPRTPSTGSSLPASQPHSVEGGNQQQPLEHGPPFNYYTPLYPQQQPYGLPYGSSGYFPYNASGMTPGGVPMNGDVWMNSPPPNMMMAPPYYQYPPNGQPYLDFPPSPLFPTSNMTTPSSANTRHSNNNSNKNNQSQEQQQQQVRKANSKGNNNMTNGYFVRDNSRTNNNNNTSNYNNSNNNNSNNSDSRGGYFPPPQQNQQQSNNRAVSRNNYPGDNTGGYVHGHKGSINKNMDVLNDNYEESKVEPIHHQVGVNANRNASNNMREMSPANGGNGRNKNSSQRVHNEHQHQQHQEKDELSTSNKSSGINRPDTNSNGAIVMPILDGKIKSNKNNVGNNNGGSLGNNGRVVDKSGKVGATTPIVPPGGVVVLANGGAPRKQQFNTNNTRKLGPLGDSSAGNAKKAHSGSPAPEFNLEADFPSLTLNEGGGIHNSNNSTTSNISNNSTHKQNNTSSSSSSIASNNIWNKSSLLAKVTGSEVVESGPSHEDISASIHTQKEAANLHFNDKTHKNSNGLRTEKHGESNSQLVVPRGEALLGGSSKGHITNNHRVVLPVENDEAINDTDIKFGDF